ERARLLSRQAAGGGQAVVEHALRRRAQASRRVGQERALRRRDQDVSRARQGVAVHLADRACELGALLDAAWADGRGAAAARRSEGGEEGYERADSGRREGAQRLARASRREQQEG